MLKFSMLYSSDILKMTDIPLQKIERVYIARGNLLSR